MIIKSIRKLSVNLQAAIACMMLVAAAAGTATLPAPTAFAAATYSCGTYSSGAYSANTSCNEATGSVGAPNTGFAKLVEPANLAAILGSLALLIAGIVIIAKSRRRKTDRG